MRVLCNDCYRTVNRIVENARKVGLSPVLKGFRFHADKIKTLPFRINQNATAKSDDRKTRYKEDYDTIISRTEDVVRTAEAIVQRLNANGSELALVFTAELSAHIPNMNTIVSVARRRFKGETVPNEEKVFSLFEPHTRTKMYPQRLVERPKF